MLLKHQLIMHQLNAVTISTLSTLQHKII